VRNGAKQEVSCSKEANMPLMARLKELPWRLLGVEFVVVVLGILCALAADSWWENVQERRTETGYLLRLSGDLRMSRDSLVEDLATHRHWADSTRLVLVELRTGPNPDGPELLQKAIGLATSLSVWYPYHTTYEELLATGNLALISSDSLRAALGAYDRLVRDNADWDDWMEKQFLASIEPVLLKTLIYSDVLPEWAERRGIPTSRFEEDFSSLYEDRSVWNALVQKLDLEEGILEARERLLRALDTAFELTEEELAGRGFDVGNAPAS
jgi:hypothetical protein